MLLFLTYVAPDAHFLEIKCSVSDTKWNKIWCHKQMLARECAQYNFNVAYQTYGHLL